MLSSLGSQPGARFLRTDVHRVIPRLWTIEMTGGCMAGHEPVTRSQVCAQPCGRTPAALARLVADSVGQLSDLVVGRAAFAHQLTDLALSVHDRGVVAPAEQLADLGQGQLGELATEVHRDLPGGDQDPGARS